MLTLAGNRAAARYLQRETRYAPREDARKLQEEVTEGARSIRYSKWHEGPGDAAKGQKGTREEVYWAEFSVDANGVLTVSARTATQSNVRAPGWTLRGKFQEALAYFKRRNVEVKAFEAEWGYMGSHEMSTNFKEYLGAFKKQPKIKPEQAALKTPSGKIASELGFKEVENLSFSYEDAGKGGAAQPRPTVRFRFWRPGARPIPKPAGPPPTPIAKGPPAAPTTSSAKFTAGQRITAAGLLLVIVASAAFNKVISHLNKRDIENALKRSEKRLQEEQDADGSQGFLLVFRFSGGVDSGEGATAEARFQGLTWVRARNELDARAKLKDQDPSMTYQYTWVPPLTPETDWGKGGLGKFADVAKLEFLRMEFAQVGVVSKSGLRLKRRSFPANLGKEAQRFAAGLRFHVLKPPAVLRYRGARGGNETETLTIQERDVVDGRVQAIILEGTPVVPVVAADAATAEFFRVTKDIALDHSGVVREANIDEIRWLRPEQIEMLDGPFARFVDWTKKNPDWQKNSPFPKVKEPDPDQLEWDRIKGRWVQKRR